MAKYQDLRVALIIGICSRALIVALVIAAMVLQIPANFQIPLCLHLQE